MKLDSPNSQIELRCLPKSPRSQVETSLRRGLDIHAMTQSEMLASPSDMQGEVRRRRQRNQTSNHLRHLASGWRPSLASHAKKPGLYIRKYSSVPRHPRTWRKTKTCPRERPVLTLLGASALIRTIRNSNTRDVPSMTRRHQCAPAGQRRRLHRRAMVRMEEALGKRISAHKCSCRSTTN